MIVTDIAVTWDNIKYTCKECGAEYQTSSKNGFFKKEDFIEWFGWTQRHKHSNGFEISTWCEKE